MTLPQQSLAAPRTSLSQTRHQASSVIRKLLLVLLATAFVFSLVPSDFLNMPIPLLDILEKLSLPVAEAALSNKQPPLAFASLSSSSRSTVKRLSLHSSSIPTPASTHDDVQQQPQQQQQHLVLVGGGHAHVQVIKALNAQARPEHLRVTLVDAQVTASYSGMVPGTICGQYTPDQTLLHLDALAAWAGIDFAHGKVIDIDLERKQVYFLPQQQQQQQHAADNVEPVSLGFDCISLDIGSTSRDLDVVKGAFRYSIPTRPIHKLIQRLDRARLELIASSSQHAAEENKNDNSPKLVVIGGGAAGIELALAVSNRWKQDCSYSGHVSCTLLDAGDELLPQESPAARQKLREILRQQDICVQHGCQVSEITDSHVILKKTSTAGQRGAGSGMEDSLAIPYTECIWATGAGAHPLARHLHRVRGLHATERGWFTVHPTLQSTSHPFVFAAGDCCHIQDLVNGPPAKAGVYAVRSGPILIENLTRYLDSLRQTQTPIPAMGEKNSVVKDGREHVTTTTTTSTRPLINYEPQDDFLKLLVCGNGKALGFRFGLALYGKWVMDIKDSIDRSFMSLFAVDHLPDHRQIQRGDYDTQQYDAQEQEAEASALPSASEAAVLLQRTDDEVDYREAFRVLKAMARDVEYQQNVLDHVEQVVTPAAGQHML